MLKKEVLNIEGLSSKVSEFKKEYMTSEVKEDRLEVTVKIFNPENRTLYSYGSPRRILYNNTTKTLEVDFHDQHIDDNSPIGIHLKEPKIVLLEANKETEFKFRLPLIMKRMKGFSEGGGTEILNINQAEEIKLEIAHQDTPFYYNPKINNAKQLKEWGNVIAKAEFNLKTGRKIEPRKGNDKKKK